MQKNFTKYLFYFMLIISTLISISSNSWLGAWIGLEVNLLSFIPMMINVKNALSTESAVKYFLIQAIASSFLLLAVITVMSNFKIFNLEHKMYLILSFTLLMKVGAAPFHFWFPDVMKGLSWTNNLIIMTWQKIAPLVLLTYHFNFNLMCFIIIISVIMGSLGGFNQTNLKMIMAYSSINHLGWIMSGMMISNKIWTTYFYMYSLLTFSVVYLFNYFNLIHITQAFSLNYKPMIKFMLFLSLLSLGGLPPLLGFIPKWIIIQNLLFMNQMFLLLIMVMTTLITLFFYLRVGFSTFLFNNSKTNWWIDK